MQLIIVTGTNTGVGKTIVTAAVAACAIAAHRTVAVVKPVQTGVAPTGVGDLQEVARLSGAGDLHEYARYGEALAPGTAARRLGVRGPTIADIAKRAHELAVRDVVLIEGAGGPLVELNSAGETLVDLARELGRDHSVDIVLVASPELGVLNTAGLAARVLTAAGLPPCGVVIGAWPTDPDLAARCNVIDLPRYTATPLVGAVPAGAGSLLRMQFAAQARTWLAPRLGGVFDPAEFSRAVTSHPLVQEVHP